MGSALKAILSPISGLENGWTGLRDNLETAGTLAGNYYLPGSSLLTDQLASKGSQNTLNSTVGRIANTATGLAGAGVGSSTTGIPAASDVGGGWTNTANNVGGAFGDATLGTDAARQIGNAANSITGGISDAASSVGNTLGLTGSGSSSSSPGFFSRLFGSGSSPTSAFSPGEVDMQAPSSIGASALKSGVGPSVSGLSSALSSGTGGGASSYLPIAGAAIGGLNSLNANVKAQKDLLEANRNALGQLDPYLASGSAANNRLSDLLGNSTNTGASGYGSLTKPFDAESLTSDPGYKFQLDQGNQAIDRKAAAGGGYFSGAALKAAQDYGQGLASTTFGNAFARDQSQKQQQYGMLAGQAGNGLSAANTAAGIDESTGNAKANAGISSSNILNNTFSSMLSGSGAKRLIGYGQNGQPLYV